MVLKHGNWTISLWKYPLNMFNCHVWLPKGKHLFPASHIFISTRTGEVRQWLQRSQNSFHLAVLCRCQTLLVGCFNPSEQILVSWDDSSQYMEKMFQTTNQLWYVNVCSKNSGIGFAVLALGRNNSWRRELNLDVCRKWVLLLSKYVVNFAFWALFSTLQDVPRVFFHVMDSGRSPRI